MDMPDACINTVGSFVCMCPDGSGSGSGDGMLMPSPGDGVLESAGGTGCT